MKKQFLFLFVLSTLADGILAHTTALVPEHGSALRVKLSPDSTLLVIGADQNEVRIQTQPEAAGLLLPAAGEENRKKKRCMTVCSSWGEECAWVSRNGGVVSKKCRRACKSFSEECL